MSKKEEESKPTVQEPVVQTQHSTEYSILFEGKLYKISAPLVPLDMTIECLEYFIKVAKDSIKQASEKKSEKTEVEEKE